MKNLFYIATVITLISCSTTQKKDCKGQILDLEMNSFDAPNNKLLNYYKTNSFVEIIDTNQLLRFEELESVAYFFQRSTIDSAKRKYIYKVKEAIIKTNNYQWDLIIMVDNDEKMENVYYTLVSYDNNRKQVGHLDFAHWSAAKKMFSSGRVDCDSTLHMMLNNGKEERIWKTDKTGKNYLIETKQQ